MIGSAEPRMFRKKDRKVRVTQKETNDMAEVLDNAALIISA
jgi:hypothetical protein